MKELLWHLLLTIPTLGISVSNATKETSILNQGDMPKNETDAGLSDLKRASGLNDSTTDGTNATIKPYQDCNCDKNETQTVPPHVIAMQEAIQNKTTMLSKIRHRATHSKDAMMASVVLTLVVVMLVVGVLHTRMWKERNFLSYQDSQPVKYEQYSKTAEIPVREMLRSRARSLLVLFSPRKEKDVIRTSPVLKMQTFLDHNTDQVDSAHQALLESSSDDDMWNDSDSSDDIVFKINKRTGDWEGEAMFSGEERNSRTSLLGGEETSTWAALLGGTRGGDSGRTPLLNDISRVSSCSESSNTEQDFLKRIG